jgi:hypothetical protein
MRKLVVAGTLALLIVMTPLSVMAQGGLDETTLATVVALVKQVGHVVDPDAVALSHDTDIVDSAPIPQTEGPKTEPGDDTAELPPLNLTDLAQYTSQGVTFQVPADWDVNTDAGTDTPFEIDVPNTDVVLALTVDDTIDFPSWLQLALFRSQAERLITELGEDEHLGEATTLYTAQNLPMVKLTFTGVEDDKPVAGTLYSLAPNASAYLLVAGGAADEWAYAEPGVDLIAKSITFDEDMVTAVQATDEPLDFSDKDGTIQVTVPVGWYATATGDSQFPLILSEPEARYAVAVGTAASFGDDFDADKLQEFVPAEGDLDPSKYSDLLDRIVEMLNNSSSPINLDEEQSEVSTREGAVTVRLVGDAEVGEDVALPVILYIELRSDSAVAVAIFGDTESALSVEEDIRALVESVTEL